MVSIKLESDRHGTQLCHYCRNKMFTLREDINTITRKESAHCRMGTSVRQLTWFLSQVKDIDKKERD